MVEEKIGIDVLLLVNIGLPASSELSHIQSELKTSKSYMKSYKLYDTKVSPKLVNMISRSFPKDRWHKSLYILS